MSGKADHLSQEVCIEDLLYERAQVHDVLGCSINPLEGGNGEIKRRTEVAASSR
ncbi:hypothetical protein HZZ13_00445 [Bradyrhizobium sp. CNPSo 4010]|uniref:Uncharacterized protein n=1 Tax=Bradyrhizobium agreste TaxID=2751811 RepID=A0ABS0PGS1_9BRAD|nr:hypothetical protein [Bradyrhizobium agreste]